MLQLYSALVRLVLDYGSIVYGCVSATDLRTLDAVHHAGIHLATGAFCTSRIECLLVDAGNLLFSCIETCFFAATVLRYLVFQTTQHIGPFCTPNMSLPMLIGRDPEKW